MIIDEFSCVDIVQFVLNSDWFVMYVVLVSRWREKDLIFRLNSGKNQHNTNKGILFSSIRLVTNTLKLKTYKKHLVVPFIEWDREEMKKQKKKNTHETSYQWCSINHECSALSGWYVCTIPLFRWMFSSFLSVYKSNYSCGILFVWIANII